MSTMTPREIVHELDRHIVGQNAAKRAVALALRNRWRRMQLPEDQRHEVTPKNILMIGPPASARPRSPVAWRGWPTHPSSRLRRPSSQKSVTSDVMWIR